MANVDPIPEDVPDAPGPAKALPEHMRRISGAVLGGSGSGHGRPSLAGMNDSGVNLHNQRRSSIFSTEMIHHRMGQDRGNSTVSCDEAHTKLAQKVLYENTFIMEPSGFVNLPPIKEMITRVLEEKLKGSHYNPHTMGYTIKKITDSLKEEVGKLNLGRYKVVCTAAIYQNLGQGVHQYSRCLWFDKFDNWIDASFENGSLIGQGSVYLMYYE